MEQLNLGDLHKNQNLRLQVENSDRWGVWNPGRLPDGLTGYIEHLGTGTTDMIADCEEYGLRTPEFIQAEDFRTIIWRKEKVSDPSPKVSDLNEKVSNPSPKVSKTVFFTVED